MRNTQHKVATFVIFMLLPFGIAACGGAPGASTMTPPISAPMINPSSGNGTPTYLMLVDASKSVLQTDLVALAQNRAQQLVSGLPVGTQLVVRALNNNVTAECNELKIAMNPQDNLDLEQQERDANLAAVGPSLQNYIDCMQTSYQGGTELFGGMAEGLTFYSDPVSVDVYTDGCENVTVANVCNPARLHNAAYPATLIASLPAAVIPQLTPQVPITFHAVGRGTNLDAASVSALRTLLGGWVAATTASCSFLET